MPSVEWPRLRGIGDVLGRGPFLYNELASCPVLSPVSGSTSALGCVTDCLAEERGVPKEEVKTWIPYPGGAPANVAAALGRLGVRVTFVSAVGEDELGEEMLDLLESETPVVQSCVNSGLITCTRIGFMRGQSIGHGFVFVGRHVDLTHVQRVPQPTRDVLVTRDEAGEREFSGFGAAKNDEYADCFIDADKVPESTIKVKTCMPPTKDLVSKSWQHNIDSAKTYYYQI